MIYLQQTSFLPDISCKHCGIGLEIEDSDRPDYEFSNEEKNCPNCGGTLLISRMIFTKYTVE